MYNIYTHLIMHPHMLFLQTGFIKDWRGVNQIRPRYNTRTLDKIK